MTDKDAMKLALEALELAHPRFGIGTEKHKQAIAALRLAPDYERGFVDGMQKQMQSSVDKAVNAMAQPKQGEPVCPECKAGVLYECVACSSNNYPPQRTWVGLTDREFEEVTHGMEDLEDCWIAIEAKLKEKNA
jgi:hypothetical protein